MKIARFFKFAAYVTPYVFILFFSVAHATPVPIVSRAHGSNIYRLRRNASAQEDVRDLLESIAVGHAWQRPGVRQVSFCTDPVVSVCGSNGQVAIRRAAHIELVRSRLESKILPEIARNFNFPRPESFRRADLDALKKRKFRLWIQVSRQFNRSMRLGVLNLVRNHLHDLSSRFMKVKEDLQWVVRREFGAAQAALATEALQIMQDTAVADLGWLLTMEHGRETGAILKDFESNCGIDGLEDNAYQDTFFGQPNVVICPGYLLVTLAQNDASMKANFSTVGLIMTLAHEMAHHFDADMDGFQTVYSDFLECMDQTYPDQLERRMKRYKNEIIADYFGVAALAQFLERENLDASSPDKLSQAMTFVAHNLEDLCGEDDDGTHPSGAYRIANITGSFPSIASQLGCGSDDQTEKMRRCDLANAVKFTRIENGWAQSQ